MKHMSFSMTTDAVLNRTKTVTRRFGWEKLKAGDLVQPIEKAQGLKRGEKQVLLGGPVRVLNTRREPLNAVTAGECAKEGFPELSPEEFVAMLTRKYRVPGEALITRIEFEYI